MSANINYIEELSSPSLRSKYALRDESPTLEVTTMIGCPLLCTFCPQERLKTEYKKRSSEKYLSMDNFRKMLRKVPKSTEIHFSGKSEPWANPECTNFLREALEGGYNVAIFTTLYGMRDPHVVKDLLEKYDKQVRRLKIHLPDSMGNMLGWRLSEEWISAYKIISTVKVSCGVTVMTMDAKGELDGRVVSLVEFDMKPWMGNTRAGMLDKKKINGQHVIEQKNNSRFVCKSTPYYDHNGVLPNGDVELCCQDYGMQHILGNLLEQNYEDIFFSPEKEKIIKANLLGASTDGVLCKSCENIESLDGVVYHRRRLRWVFKKLKKKLKKKLARV